MTDANKQFTSEAKLGIKGEAFFESLVSDYSIPHHIVGSKDLGIDYICEWVPEKSPTGILFAVQVKTRSKDKVRLTDCGSERRNKLQKHTIISSNLEPDERTQQYWRGFGMPVYLFAILYESTDQGGQTECFYKRFTPVLTKSTSGKSSAAPPESEYFYRVNNGNAFLAFVNNKEHGFARDLFIDLMRCSYAKGSISYINPRILGLEQFPEKAAVFREIFEEYRENICTTYKETRSYLEQVCNATPVRAVAEPLQAEPSMEAPEVDFEDLQ